ncbi:hypothetical protein HDU93_000958 [Gonapodya sp. JEL0774]|nr:hypothetical protein HDU93_000958 [Gonapodya sp. JEL0774]
MSYDSAVARLLNVHRALVNYAATPTEEIRLLFDAALSALDFLVRGPIPVEEADRRWRALAVKKIVAIYMVAIGELGTRFKETVDIPTKQTIRFLQSMTTLLIFRAADLCLDLASIFPDIVPVLEGSVSILTGLEEQPDKSPNQRGNDLQVQVESDGESHTAPLEMLSPVAVVATWLGVEGNGEVLQIAQGYTGWAGWGEGKEGGAVVAKIRLSFLRSLASLLNHIPPSYLSLEMDGPIPEDVDYLGSTQFLSYCAKFPHEALVRILVDDGTVPEGAGRDYLERRLIRIRGMAMRMVRDDKLELKYDQQDDKLVVMDEEMRRQGLHKLSRRLATERLRDQVDQLEKAIANEPALAVLATDVFVNRMPLIRRWVASGKVVMVLSMAVIDDLDVLKKGNEKENAHAREAIRFIEQRQVLLRSGHAKAALRSQKVFESKTLDWKLVESGRGVFVNAAGEEIKTVPKSYRSILACSAWYADTYGASVSAAGVHHHSGLRVNLVTDDADLIHYAHVVGIPTMGTSKFQQDVILR